ncbi:MAG: hypothetical protein LQ345_001482, partial [Seirophora villosa]
LFAASKRLALSQKDNTATSFDKDNRDSLRPSLAESTTTSATLVQEPDTEHAAHATGPAGRQLTQPASQSEEPATELVKCIYDIATDNEEVASSQAKMLWQTHKPSVRQLMQESPDTWTPFFINVSVAAGPKETPLINHPCSKPEPVSIAKSLFFQIFIQSIDPSPFQPPLLQTGAVSVAERAHPSELRKSRSAEKRGLRPAKHSWARQQLVIWDKSKICKTEQRPPEFNIAFSPPATDKKSTHILLADNRFTAWLPSKPTKTVQRAEVEREMALSPVQTSNFSQRVTLPDTNEEVPNRGCRRLKARISVVVLPWECYRGSVQQALREHQSGSFKNPHDETLKGVPILLKHPPSGIWNSLDAPEYLRQSQYCSESCSDDHDEDRLRGPRWKPQHEDSTAIGFPPAREDLLDRKSGQRAVLKRVVVKIRGKKHWPSWIAGQKAAIPVAAMK